jgi:hypothetical protein
VSCCPFRLPDESHCQRFAVHWIQSDKIDARRQGGEITDLAVFTLLSITAVQKAALPAEQIIGENLIMPERSRLKDKMV